MLRKIVVADSEAMEPACKVFTYEDSRPGCEQEPVRKGYVLEALANLCDKTAEDRNVHDFVGVHRLLAAVLIRYMGRAAATILMMEIAQHDGLHGMNGNGTSSGDDAYKDYRLPKPWRDWRLTE